MYRGIFRALECLGCRVIVKDFTDEDGGGDGDDNDCSNLIHGNGQMDPENVEAC